MRDAFEKNLEANNVKLLFMVGDPNFQILLKDKKINGMNDFKGMRLKCGGFADETLKAWGAVPVQLKHGDMYLAMQRGVVDGIVFPLGAAKSFKLEEVTKYVFKTDFFSYHLFMGMNLDTWNRLPKELQDAVMRASAKAAYLSGFHYQNTDGAALQAYLDKGVEIYEPGAATLAELKASTSAIRERLIQKLEKDGLPAAKTLDRMEALMADYRRWSRPTALKPVYK
jgi:TRAP-type C4-dicarboxylate transport system substrate-binding protein